MFTSRAEYRLKLRADNADQRLTPRGLGLGCVGPERAEAFAAKSVALAEARRLLDEHSLTPSEAGRHGLAVNKDGRRRSAFELMAIPGIDLARLRPIWPALDGIDPAVAAQVEVDARYAAYVERQEADVAALRRDESVKIPTGFDFSSLPGLSTEIRQKLAAQRPATIAHAGRIDGITPAALLLLSAALKAAGERRTG